MTPPQHEEASVADADPLATSRLDRWAARIRRAAALYGVLLFVATHVPPPGAMAPAANDKLLHWGAYGIFTLAVLLAWHATARGLRPRNMLLIGLAVAVYGAFDEVTQIPVGRIADVGDWCADVAGIATGVVVYLLLRRPIFGSFLPRRSPAEPPVGLR